MLLHWFLAVFSVAAPAVTQPVCTDPECWALSDDDWNDYDYYYGDTGGVSADPYYYNLLETALLNDSKNLYQLQLALFPSSGSPRVVKQVQVGITLIVSGGVDDDFCGFKYNWRERTFVYDNEQWLSYTWQDGSSLSVIASRELFTAMLYEGIIALAKLFSALAAPWNPEMYTGGLGYRDVQLTLTLDHLKCNPQRRSTDFVIRCLLSWLKQYAIAKGKPDTWDEGNRGEVDDNEEIDQTTFDNTVDKLTLAIFVLINISVMLVMVRVTPGLYSKLVDKVSEETNLNKLYCTLYWGGTTVLFFVVIVLFLADVVALCGIYFLSWMFIPHTAPVWAVAVILKVFVLVVEFGVCAFTCHGNKKGIDFPFRRFTNVYCCCCCCCKCCSQNIKYQAVQTLALWAIVSFVQHLAMSAVPIFFIIIVYPGEAFSLLATSLSGLFCIIMLVSHVLFICQTYGARSSRRVFVAMFVVQMLLIVSLLGVVIAFVMLYITLLGNGATFSGLGGWAVSLIPSAILAVIGWFVKTKLLKSTSVRTPQNGSVNQEPGDTATANEQTSLV